MDWQEIVQLVADASSEIPLVEALCDVQISDDKNLQLALMTLRELPAPEPYVCAVATPIRCRGYDHRAPPRST